MSLTKPSMAKTVQQQFRFKLKGFAGMFMTLFILQLIGLLFSLTGNASFSSTNAGTELSIQYYSADIVVAFTMLWGFMSATQIKTKAYREDDFIFVTSRLSSDLANIVFLAVTSLLGGITALLSGFLLKVVVYFLFDSTPIIQSGFTDTPGELLTGMLAAAMFIFMLSSAGYLTGTFVHLHKILAYIIPAAVIGLIILWPRITGTHLLPAAGEFYFQERSFWLFTCKMMVTTGVLLAGSIVISHRLEVRT
ncbi:hypothetical protein [Lentibacillus salinarum]|uniref:ABC transporter permease n=1 Tax=Lentibacillus salinarum TaxID=446820 RepID=A0ABW3ZYU7_9BACI